MAEERIVLAKELAFAVYDAFPVASGHALVIPRRHVLSFFEMTEQELLILYQLLREMRNRIDRELDPDGYNIGVNNGPAAGQTITHIHVHLIPRYVGDVSAPEGGIRNVIPGRGCY